MISSGTWSNDMAAHVNDAAWGVSNTRFDQIAQPTEFDEMKLLASPAATLISIKPDFMHLSVHGAGYLDAEIRDCWPCYWLRR